MVPESSALGHGNAHLSAPEPASAAGTPLPGLVSTPAGACQRPCRGCRDHRPLRKTPDDVARWDRRILPKAIDIPCNQGLHSG